MIWFLGFVVVINIAAVVLVAIKAKRANEEDWEEYIRRDKKPW